MGMDGKRVGLEQNDETVVFCEDRLRFRARPWQVVGQNAWHVALGDIGQDAQGLAHNPLSVRMRARAASGDRAFSG